MSNRNLKSIRDYLKSKKPENEAVLEDFLSEYESYEREKVIKNYLQLMSSFNVSKQELIKFYEDLNP